MTSLLHESDKTDAFNHTWRFELGPRSRPFFWGACWWNNQYPILGESRYGFWIRVGRWRGLHIKQASGWQTFSERNGLTNRIVIGPLAFRTFEPPHYYHEGKEISYEEHLRRGEPSWRDISA